MASLAVVARNYFFLKETGGGGGEGDGYQDLLFASPISDSFGSLLICCMFIRRTGPMK